MSPKYYTISTELSDIHLEETLDFISEYFLQPQPENFKNTTKTFVNGVANLNFKAINEKEKWEVLVELQATNPFMVKMTPGKIPPDFNITKSMDLIEEELLIAVQVFEDTIRQATLYFAWVEGEENIPEAPPTRRKKASLRIFGSNMILIYLLFFAVNIVLFLSLGIIMAIIAILALQLVIVLFSDKI